MRVVHLTDLHFQVAPKLRDLLGKRLVATLNLYALGRKAKFSAAVQRGAVEAAIAEKPDVVVFTGDMTAQGLDSEFDEARRVWDPLLLAAPAVMIAGNHDTYVREPGVGAAMRRVFGPWMAPEEPHLHEFDDVCFLTLETCRPHLLSAGRAEPGQLPRAGAALDRAGGRFCFLCIHYPLRGRDGRPYGPPTRALSNAAEVETWLRETRGIGAILHGHAHHGYRIEIATGSGPVPIFNPGSSGYVLDRKRDRTAHLNVYEVERAGIRSVRRLAWNGTRFEDEADGPYATGR